MVGTVRVGMIDLHLALFVMELDPGGAVSDFNRLCFDLGMSEQTFGILW
jgi:hypothetical protein